MSTSAPCVGMEDAPAGTAPRRGASAPPPLSSPPPPRSAAAPPTPSSRAATASDMTRRRGASGRGGDAPAVSSVRARLREERPPSPSPSLVPRPVQRLKYSSTLDTAPSLRGRVKTESSKRRPHARAREHVGPPSECSDVLASRVPGAVQVRLVPLQHGVVLAPLRWSVAQPRRGAATRGTRATPGFQTVAMRNSR